MSRKPLGKVEIVAMGNWMGKARRNFMISNRCWHLMHELSLELGISHSAVIELSVRETYQRVYGRVPEIPLITKRLEE